MINIRIFKVYYNKFSFVYQLIYKHCLIYLNSYAINSYFNDIFSIKSLLTIYCYYSFCFRLQLNTFKPCQQFPIETCLLKNSKIELDDKVNSCNNLDD